MSVVSHLEHLQAKHAELETKLAEELAHPMPDFFVIKDLKKQKLLLKEEITHISQAYNKRQNVS